MNVLEPLEKVDEYRSRATLYLENFHEEALKGDREKAGEALWGAVACLLNAIHLLMEGKTPNLPRGDEGVRQGPPPVPQGRQKTV